MDLGNPLEETAQISPRLMKMNEQVVFSDAHFHLDLFDNPATVVADARKAGIGIMITAGSDAASNLRMLELCREDVYGVAGISPDFSSADFSRIGELAELVKMNRNIVGFGEIGLDATAIEKAGMEKQRAAFVMQLDIARELGVPVVVHARRALGAAMEILEKEEMERVVFHYFEGDEKEARIIERRGWLISVPPVESSRRKRAIKEVELDSLVVESDSPAVGRSPADVLFALERIALLKGISTDEVGERVTKTIKEYFYI